jgi:predicted TIM-barrel fold metal-dependent hydrolase
VPRLTRLLLLGVCLLLGAGCAEPGAMPDGRLRIFDTHLHYSQDAWEVHSVDAVLALLDRAGVYRALVSSTPDDGTLMLHARAPKRIVPVLRPYRTRADMLTWTQDPSVLEYVEERLRQGGYRGIGEFHLYGGRATDPVPLAFAELAARHGLVLHAHADAAAVQELAQLRPDVTVLWAHAGMGAPPGIVEAMLEAHPNLYADLALRSDVAPGGQLDPAWAALFQRYSDRFMIGTDTWIPSQWDRLPELMDRVRAWLAQLPPRVAEQIAFRNAERLFGS